MAMYRIEAKELDSEPGAPLHEWSSVSVVGSNLDAALLRVTRERLFRPPESNIRFRLLAPNGTVVEEPNT